MKLNNAQIKLWKTKIHIVCKELFHYALFTYLIALVAEMIKSGIVTYFFNLNILLEIVLLSGLAMIITNTEEILPTFFHKKLSWLNIGYSIILAILGGFFVYVGTFDLGNIAIIVGCLACILILFLSLLLQIT